MPQQRETNHPSTAETAMAGALLLAAAILLSPLKDLASYTSTPLIDPAGVLQVYPWVHFNAAELMSGHFPLWNPYTALGEPHLANVQTAVFFPLYWVWEALGHGGRAYGAILIFRLWLAGMFWFWFTRTRMLSFTGALIAAAAYSLGGYGLWFMQLIDLNSQMLLPLCMASFAALVTRPGLKAFMASALLTALAVFGGHPEAAFITLTVAGLYALAALASAKGRTRSWYGPAALILAGSLGLILTAAITVPFVNYLSRCWTMHGSGFGFFHLDPRGLFNLVLPGAYRFFHDMPREIPVQNISNGALTMLGLPYSETSVPGNLPGAGPVICALALIGMIRARKLPWQALFFIGLSAITLGLTFGLPVFRLIALIPPFNVNSNFKFFFSEVHVCIAVLAGCGADELIEAIGRRTTRARLVRAAMMAIVLVGLGVNRLAVFPYVHLEVPDKELVRVIEESRLTGMDGYWPANMAMNSGLKDVRSSDALFYKPYVELMDRINGLTAEQGLGYFYPSYYMQPSPERLIGVEAQKLCVRTLVGSARWEPHGITDGVIRKGSGIFGVTASARERFDDQDALFAHAPMLTSFVPGELAVLGRDEKVRDRGTLSFAPEIKDADISGTDGVLFQAVGSGKGARLRYSRFCQAHCGRVELDIPAMDRIELSTLPGPDNNRDSDWSGFVALAFSFGGYQPPPPPDFPMMKDRFAYTLASQPWAHEEGGNGELAVLRNAGDEVEVYVNQAAGKTLIVHEAWYPGWRLEMDDRPWRIDVPGDKASWRVSVPEGAKEAVFKFEPADFRVGLFASIGVLLASLITVIMKPWMSSDEKQKI